MRIVTAFALFVGIVVLSGNGLYSQDKKDTTPPKAKGMLPLYYGKIGLSDGQKQDIYKIQAKYKEEIQKLEDKLAEIKLEERKEINKILTPEQRKKLEEVITGEKK